jgi:hypothetical protein
VPIIPPLLVVATAGLLLLQVPPGSAEKTEIAPPTQPVKVPVKAGGATFTVTEVETKQPDIV